ncbi:MAG: hypothetical protein ACREVN_04105 [Gammaproteobacteria bacterium]
MKYFNLAASATVSALMVAGVSAEPNQNSIAQYSACLDQTTVFVCSSKDLSNVVLQCASGAEKFDDLDSLGVGASATFSCSDGSVPTSVWVKSGSQQSGDGAGYGGIFSPQECPTECPAIGDSGSDEGGEDGGDDLPEPPTEG